MKKWLTLFMALPAFLPQKVGFPERSVHSSAHLVAFLPVDRIPCHEDNIIARNDRNAEKTIRFSHQATRPISLHAVSHFFAGNKSHSRLGKSVLFIQNDDKSAYPGFSLLINRFEVSLIAQYVLFDHLNLFPCRTAGKKLYGQLLSSSRSSSLENFSSGSGCHSLSESVLLESLPLLWLVCSFHFTISFRILLCYTVSTVLPSKFQRHRHQNIIRIQIKYVNRHRFF